jgi:hypothetical protein
MKPKTLSYADLTPLSRVQVARLVTYLERMTDSALELGCTCMDRGPGSGVGKNNHQKDCTGIRITRNARAYLTRLKRKRFV